MNLIHLKTDQSSAVIAPEAGGRLVQITARLGEEAIEFLVAPDDVGRLLEEPLAWGCYPMAPWPGRVDGSRFNWNGAEYKLPANDGLHSIHGRAMYYPWSVELATQQSCVMAVRLDADRGWPFACTVRQHIELREDGVNLRMEVRTDAEPFPAGAGWHPWFRRDVREGAEPSVRVPAAVHYERRDDLIPTGAAHEPAGAVDLRSGDRLGERQLDDFYGGVVNPIDVRWGALHLRMTSGWNVQHAVVFTQQERGFCVEPQTCAPDAFNLAARGVEGTGLAVVEPGVPLVAQTSWRWNLDAR
jgi:aldose 1-epimerase